MLPHALHSKLPADFQGHSVSLPQAFQQDRGLGLQDGSQRARNRCSYRYVFSVCRVVGMDVERNGWG